MRTRYARTQIEVRGDEYGLYKFCDWLPVRRMLSGSSAPVTYKSKGAGRAPRSREPLHYLQRLQSGHWRRDDHLFVQRRPKRSLGLRPCPRRRTKRRVLVVASAGNTARAFAKVCSDNHIPLLLSVPSDNIGALWFDEPLDPCVKLICCDKGGDYFDAIHLSNLAPQESPMFYSEGGAKNIARRDGMATTVALGRDRHRPHPDYYFPGGRQRHGRHCGLGGQPAADRRRLASVQHLMKLIVSQNAPFVPMYDAWRADSRVMLPYDDDKARRDAEIIDAKVLSNRRPPYGIAGRSVRCAQGHGRRRDGGYEPPGRGVRVRCSASWRAWTSTPRRAWPRLRSSSAWSRAVSPGRRGDAQHHRRRRGALPGGPSDVVSEALPRVPPRGRGRCRRRGGRSAFAKSCVYRRNGLSFARGSKRRRSRTFSDRVLFY